MPANKTDRKFMELAVEEMAKSRSEHSDKSDPMVGAVLVGPDRKLLGATHRGALRVGDHAEFTLIERYLRDTKLEGATVYVTLEPCTQRNAPKKPCAQHIVKARIARAFVGTTDPNPDIRGNGVQHLLNHGVEVDFFDVDLVSQIREANKDFIDYYESPKTAKKASPKPFEGPSRQELESVPRAELEDLSHDALARFVAQRGLDVPVPSDELWKILERSGYVARVGRGKKVPTVAGVVLFGSSPPDILPQCRVSIEAKMGGRTVPGDFEGPLLAFRDHLDAFFTDNMRHFTEIREFERVRVGEYPTEALREAAFNAVIHRDYRAGARVHITLRDGELEVKSPGGLLEPLTLNRVRTFNAPPYSRNPHIALAVHRMGWIEEKGSGLGRMRDTMMAHGLRPPLFDFDDGYFIATLPGYKQAWSTVRVAPDLRARLDPLEQQILDMVMNEGRISTKTCSSRFGIGRATAKRRLSKLRDMGVVELRGEGSMQHYGLSGS